MSYAEVLRQRAAMLLCEALRETYPPHRHSLLLEAGEMNMRALQVMLNERGRNNPQRRPSPMELPMPA
jgi:hypothetical protein